MDFVAVTLPPEQGIFYFVNYIIALTSIDPDTNTMVALFSPRADVWSEHFLVRDGHILGLTPTGRATARLLNMNAARRVELRREWSAKVEWR
jgi:hypothetical protein